MTPADRVERIREECGGVWAQSGITSWERSFLDSIAERVTLSERQEEILAEIERKAFDEAAR